MDQQIWLGVIDSDRYYRYYAKLARKLRKWQTVFDWLLVLPLASMAGLLATQFLEGAPLGVVLSLLAATVSGLVVWQWRNQYGTKAAAAAIISTQYKALGEDWRRLWFQGANDDVLLAILTERTISIGTQYDLPLDEKLNIEATDESYSIVVGELSPTA